MGCVPHKNLEAYAQELIQQSTPGIYTRQFVDKSLALSPDLYLLNNLNQLNSIWNHLEERNGQDIIKNAEDIFRMKDFNGDCEDYSVLIMALCKFRNIDAHFCLGKNTNTHTGHIWIEIPICAIETYDGNMKTRIQKLLNHNTCARKRKGKVWLSFMNYNDLNRYTLEYTVDVRGVISDMSTNEER